MSKPYPCMAKRPAPRAPSGNQPARAPASAARPSSSSGVMVLKRRSPRSKMIAPGTTATSSKLPASVIMSLSALATPVAADSP